MSKPWIHAQSSARKYSGDPQDYLAIHNFMDSSKSVICDNRHRALTHNSWFLSVVLEKVFGITITNSAGKIVSVRDIGEQHVFEDFGFIPSGQDFLGEMEYKTWMEGKGKPPSYQKIESSKKIITREIQWDND
jgi:uncharacterized protein DUF6915